jgi:hypothetical protein
MHTIATGILQLLKYWMTFYPEVLLPMTVSTQRVPIQFEMRRNALAPASAMERV